MYVIPPAFFLVVGLFMMFFRLKYSINIRFEERYCLCCGTRDIEDEYHFICICMLLYTGGARLNNQPVYIVSIVLLHEWL